MADFISSDSENIIASGDPFQVALDSDAFSAVDVEQLDPVGDSLNRTVVGLDDLLPEDGGSSVLNSYLETALRASGVRSNIHPEALFARAAHSGRYSRVPHRAREPYEFRFYPIPGTNREDLPTGGLLLPLPPEKFDVDRSSEPRTFISINQVEYSLPGSNNLASISLEGMFPGLRTRQGHSRRRPPHPVGKPKLDRPSYVPKYVTGQNYKTPKELASTFTNMMVHAQPVELFIGPPNGSSALVVNGGGLLTKMLVTVVSFTYGEAFGHPGSYVFSMQLKEWRRIYPRKEATKNNDPVKNPGTGGPAPKNPKPGPTITNTSASSPPDLRTYVIKSGDTLWDIAARYLGTGTRWPEIYTLNKKVIQAACKAHGVSTYPKGWHIWPGTKLRLPPARK